MKNSRKQSKISEITLSISPDHVAGTNLENINQ